jgi:hypothetical protein
MQTMKVTVCPCGKVETHNGWKAPRLNWQKLAELAKEYQGIAIQVTHKTCPECSQPP